jgi:hypothetical protein
MRKISTTLWIVLICFSSCQVSSISKGETVKDYATWPVYSHYFSGNPSRLIFKSSLQISKQNFSGLLVIKETSPGEYRTLFTTETGFKVFDFTIKNNSYSINYAVGALNKKFIANRLAYTVQAMLLREISPRGFLVSSTEGYTLQSYSLGKYVYELKRNINPDEKVYGQTVYVKGKKKAEALFYGGKEGVAPDSSSVSHTGFPLQATFRWLKD